MKENSRTQAKKTAVSLLPGDEEFSAREALSAQWEQRGFDWLDDYHDEYKPEEET